MFLAFKELKKNKSKFSLILMILILIIFLVLFLAGLTKGLAAATGAALENSEANYYILDESSDKLITRSNISKEDFEIISDFAKDSTIVNLQMSNVTKEGEDKKINLTYYAIDPNNFLMPEVIEGSNDLHNNEIILDNSLTEEGFKLGDVLIDASTDLKFTIVGFTENQMYGHTSIGIINLDTYENLLKTATGRNEVNFQSIALKVDENDVSKLEEYVNKNLDGKALYSSSDIIKNIPGRMAEQSTLIMMLAFLFVISAMILAVFFYITTMQKIPQFGVLKALGAKMSTLSKSLIYQVSILSLIAIFIGNVLTFISASLLPASMPFVLSFKDAVMVSLLFLMISILSSLFSIKKVSKVDAISAIGGNY
ncbi:ABC transporter permease [Caproiciproducens sp. MSJ-32]|uniref:ABC transporter permease n=1 Tax=Caproiciproducens sp. MSJ-32 TaxID=2841527 RepID=UPI001C0FDF59|nr:ABC transporter permease [Caproiciproducens sp. MSJ-32]MBU5455524.1 ABC transporter permease [Caproiciproducens sp. MSJ-32]